METIKITYVSSTGNGESGVIEVAAGTTASQLFATKVGLDKSIGNYAVRINGSTVEGEYVLQNGDRVAISPRAVKGARVAA